MLYKATAQQSEDSIKNTPNPALAFFPVVTLPEGLVLSAVSIIYAPSSVISGSVYDSMR